LSHKSLEKRIGYTFQSPTLLERALTHASKAPKHLERQEFLGDAVLGLVIASHLYQHYPDATEGDLSKMRANLVCKKALLETASIWCIAPELHVGEGERNKYGSLKSESIAANAVEAVIGAVFEDAGFETAKDVVLRAWNKRLSKVKPVNLRDAKSELQELTQSKSLGIPCYDVEDLGVNQALRFKATCSLQGEVLGQGLGQRKKEAELKAAAKALKSKALDNVMARYRN
jgi:ribonuclease-3